MFCARVSTVSKPFKKPRQAKERPSSLVTDSEGPTQLPAQSETEPSPEIHLKTTKNTEYVTSPASLRTVSETEPTTTVQTTMSPYIPPLHPKNRKSGKVIYGYPRQRQRHFWQKQKRK